MRHVSLQNRYRSDYDRGRQPAARRQILSGPRPLFEIVYLSGPRPLCVIKTISVANIRRAITIQLN